MLFGVFDNEFVAGLTGLVPAHLPRSHSLRCGRAWSAVTVLSFGRPTFLKTNIPQGSVWRHLLGMMESVTTSLL